ncbi:hypothetical protein EAE96_008376 [Botrytis aclada]|nr:hypothetical protein EAE96_008376 [Botrytis aclada]
MLSLTLLSIATAMTTLFLGTNAGPLLAERWAPELPTCTNTTDFVYAGCFIDPSSPSALLFRTDLNSQNMTVEICVDFCKGNGYKYAGLEYYGECFCGASVGGPQTSELNCSFPCTGDNTKSCGGNDILSVYQDTTFPIVDSTIISDYQPMGCYSDLGPNGRTLAWKQDQIPNADLTIEACLHACKEGGYAFAGVEYSQECYCGVVLGNGTAKVDESNCQMTCSGNTTELCGGAANLYLYVAEDLLSTDPCNGNPGGPVSSSTTASSPSTSASATAPVSSSSGTTITSTLSSSSSSYSSSLSSDTSSSASIPYYSPPPYTPSPYTPPSYSSTPVSSSTYSSVTASSSTSPASSAPASSSSSVSSAAPSSSSTSISPPSSSSTPSISASSSYSSASASSSSSPVSSSPSSSAYSSSPVSSSSSVSSAASSSSSTPVSPSYSSSSPTTYSAPTSSSSISPPSFTPPLSSSSTLSPPPSPSHSSTSGPTSPTLSSSTISSTISSLTSPSTVPQSSTIIYSSSSVSSAAPTSSTTPILPSTSTSPAPSTFSSTKPSTTPSPTTSKTSATICTTTIGTTPTPTCEYKVGNWCSNPLPPFNDQKSCLAAANTCLVQLTSCLLSAGFPGSLQCLQFSSWCQEIESYCGSYCPGSSCSNTGCRSRHPPAGYTPPVVSVKTSVYACPTTIQTSTSKPTSTTSIAPLPTCNNICVQPNNPSQGYSSYSPVGSIPIPCYTCNNLQPDYNSGYPFKLYKARTSEDSPSYQRPNCGQGCQDACDAQYESCVGNYAQGCGYGGGEGGDTYASALVKCVQQKADCYIVNEGVGGEGRCGSYGVGY